jgi:hypothetical protein
MFLSLQQTYTAHCAALQQQILENCQLACISMTVIISKKFHYFFSVYLMENIGDKQAFSLEINKLVSLLQLWETHLSEGLQKWQIQDPVTQLHTLLHICTIMPIHLVTHKMALR